jgi:hypothetical protein
MGSEPQPRIIPCDNTEEGNSYQAIFREVLEISKAHGGKTLQLNTAGLQPLESQGTQPSLAKQNVHHRRCFHYHQRFVRYGFSKAIYAARTMLQTMSQTELQTQNSSLTDQRSYATNTNLATPLASSITHVRSRDIVSSLLLGCLRRGPLW